MMQRTRIFSLVALLGTAIYAGPIFAAPPQTNVTALPVDALPTPATPAATAPANPLADQAPAASDAAAVLTPEAIAGVTPSPVNPATTQAAPVPQADHNGNKPLTAKDVSVSDAGNVEIHVSNADLVDVLKMLSMQSQTNILPSRDVKGTVTANLYDVTVREALDAILRANGCNYRERGNVIYVYSHTEWADMQKSERVLQSEVFRLFYATATNVAVLIKPVLSTDGQVALTPPGATGIGDTSTDVGANSHAIEEMIVVTDTPEVLDRVRKIIKEVDRRPQQILVEATILQASLTENTSLGVDFTLLGGVDFNALSTAVGASGGSGSGSTSATPSQEAIGGSLVDDPNGAGLVHKGLGVGNTSFTAGLPAGGARFGFITSNLSAFVQALEETTDTVVLANPKVLVLDKQKGEVKVAREDPFRGQTTVNASGVSEQAVEFLETGTMLIFRPYIAENGFIRLEIHPEDSSPLPGNASGLPPTKLTTETTTDVMVKDGRTIVISGMFRENTQISRSQIPWLGNLPGIGPLFRSQADTTTREEVIILLTPHIIKDDTEYSQGSEEALKDIERLRVGVRRGLMPFGRERLAEAEYQKAQHELDRPQPDLQKAIWHLDCAINLNPMFLEAITLKEKISGQTLTCVDNSTIRYLAKRQILSDRAALPELPRSVPVSVPPPATQAAVPAAAAAATQPASTQPMAVVTPATQPVAVLAATQPVTLVPAATEPTSQPTADASATTAPAISVTPEPPPTTQSAPMADASSTQPTVTQAPASQPSGPTAAAPASQPAPAAAATSKNGVIITELPPEEPASDLKADTQKSDK